LIVVQVNEITVFADITAEPSTNSTLGIRATTVHIRIERSSVRVQELDNISILRNRVVLEPSNPQVNGCGAFIIDSILPQGGVLFRNWLLDVMPKEGDSQKQLKKNGEHISILVGCSLSIRGPLSDLEWVNTDLLKHRGI